MLTVPGGGRRAEVKDTFKLTLVLVALAVAGGCGLCCFRICRRDCQRRQPETLMDPYRGSADDERHPLLSQPRSPLY